MIVAALGLRLYAGDHHDELPARLEDLTPDYVGDPSVYDGVYFTCPGGKFGDLSAETIVLFKVVDRGKRDREVVVVRADGSAKLEKVGNRLRVKLLVGMDTGR